ncbi:MAG: STAS domain-containing protein [Bacteroidia bacterium]
MAINLTEILKKNKKKLFEDWMKLQLQDSSLREDLISNEDLRLQSEELMNAFIDSTAFENNDIYSNEFDLVTEILSGISISRAQEGFSPRETGLYILSLKDAFIKTLQTTLKNDPKDLFEASQKINKLIDSLSIITFETFIKTRERVIIRQTDEIAEVSTPVIRVWHGVVALPIIGTLDSARTQVVMENLLQSIVDTESTIAILDISGVPAVDSLVAQHLMKTVSATRLMGAECIISGIRPEIAQTIVHLGIDLSAIITKATLQSALAYAFGILKYEIKRNK